MVVLGVIILSFGWWDCCWDCGGGLVVDGWNLGGVEC